MRCKVTGRSGASARAPASRLSDDVVIVCGSSVSVQYKMPYQPRLLTIPSVYSMSIHCPSPAACRVGRADVLADSRGGQRPADLPAGNAIGAAVGRRAGILDLGEFRADALIRIEENLEAVELVGLLEFAPGSTTPRGPGRAGPRPAGWPARGRPGSERPSRTPRASPA